MTSLQITALAVIALFYAAYFTKMLLQRRKGVQTDQIGKGGKPKEVLRIEILMKAATYAAVPAEIGSILWNTQWFRTVLGWIGIAVAGCGTSLFILAMATMRDSWRAGIPEADKTTLVTRGIYRFSRNPAFLGFDLMYLGLLLAFFNPIHLCFALFPILMLHLQILQEEQFLIHTFGQEYRDYMACTGRYLTIRRKNETSGH